MIHQRQPTSVLMIRANILYLKGNREDLEPWFLKWVALGGFKDGPRLLKMPFHQIKRWVGEVTFTLATFLYIKTICNHYM